MAKPSEQPWMLDNGRRLERRVDPALRSMRLAQAGKAVVSTPADIIDGSKNPELFLPWEVHRFLLATVFYDDPQVARAWRVRFADAVPDMVISDAFWAALERASLDYLRRQREIIALSDTMPKPSRRSSAKQLQVAQDLQEEIARKESTQCGERLRALENANTALGKERFMEFLYRAVAPSLTIAGPPTPADKLLFVARGCR